MRIGLDITQAVKRQGRGIARYIRQVLPPPGKGFSQPGDQAVHSRRSLVAEITSQ